MTGVAAWGRAAGQTVAPTVPHEGHSGHHGHLLGTVGRVDPSGLDPTVYLRSWNFNHLPADERGTFYRETARPDGTMLREYEIFAVDREIEIAPGVRFPAWTYNGQVPGPTIRATEGDRLRVRFLNQGTHPHTIHFHGWHPPDMDGSLPEHEVLPGESFVYEFDAEPAGLHLYHCHAVPPKRHIHKGLYGTFIVEPRGGRPPADELIMMMNGFDTNFDNENEVYAVNTVANAYMADPIAVTMGRPVRIYLVNITEFDLVNSFHLHGMFFDAFRPGTRMTPSDHTDTITLCQGERAILETTFRYPGNFMFHAHQSEFAELGWMGLFRPEAAHRDS
jgi:FtsP/CotA-like multicopper oxidase with cupredoxin domain